MKITLKVGLMTAAGALMMGCAGMTGGLTLDTVGPDPGQAAVANSGNGTLAVFSAYKVNADFNATDPNAREHSDYQILDMNGNSLQWIRNAAGGVTMQPVQVDLPAGKYQIKARSNGYGTVTIPVVIVAGEKTVLHLDDTANWPGKPAASQSDAVRLPDGEIVGWKAGATSQ
jgi:hypothetical protein